MDSGSENASRRADTRTCYDWATDAFTGGKKLLRLSFVLLWEASLYPIPTSHGAARVGKLT